MNLDHTGPLPDISTARWHMAISEVYPARLSLGSDLAGIVDNIPQFVYQRGARIYSDLMWSVSEKEPKLRQFVLTSSDYCKLYVSVISFHYRHSNFCGHDFVYVPKSFGIISRTPYLVFPRVVLSQIYASKSLSLLPYMSLVMHGVPIPLTSSDAVNVFAGPFDPVVLRDCGLEEDGAHTGRPLQNAFIRGSTEVELLALFDSLSLDSILSALGCLLLEQKVLLISSKWSSSFVAHLCECLRVLLHPFDWQHVYVPMIPPIVPSDLSAGELPYWIESATSTDHIHPLRFLQVPAPFLGGLKIIGKYTHSMFHHFPDLNIIDIDSDTFFAAAVRVDGESAPLPAFPRKLAQQIASRLGAAEAALSGSKTQRIARYMRWESPENMVVPKESRSVRESGESVRSVRSARDSWFGNLFRTGSSVTSESPNEDDPSNSAILIQCAVLESFVKIFFSYRNFIKFDDTDKSSFHGSNRSFMTDSFSSSFSNSSFIKLLLQTQSWDIFLRTSALHPSAQIFDAACSLFSRETKGESDSILSSLMEIPCPSGKKNRDFFFEQLLSYINQKYAIQSVCYCDPILGEGGCEDVSSVLTRMSALFSNPNLEANKLVIQGHTEIGVFILKKSILLLKTKFETPHLVFAIFTSILSDTLIPKTQHLPQFTPTASAVEDTASEITQLGDTVSLWSQHSRIVSDMKLLGGIPRNCLLEKVPLLAPFFLRNFIKSSETYFRFIFNFQMISRVDSDCGVCGMRTPLLVALRLGRWTDLLSTDGEDVSFNCSNCEGIIKVELYDSQARKEVLKKIMYLTQSSDLQRNFLAGVFVQVYRKGLRGIISVSELLKDLVEEEDDGDGEGNHPGSPVALADNDDDFTDTDVVKISINVDLPKMSDKRPQTAAPRKPRRSLGTE